MSIDAMTQALEALEMYLRLDTVEDSILLEQVIAPVAIAALRDAIEQAQEPVAWMCADEQMVHRGYLRFSPTCAGDWNIPVYTAPRQWQGLTDEEIEHCCYEADSKAKDHPKTWKWTEAFARAIEAKLRERNT
jgi:hypothetical protein